MRCFKRKCRNVSSTYLLIKKGNFEANLFYQNKEKRLESAGPKGEPIPTPLCCL